MTSAQQLSEVARHRLSMPRVDGHLHAKQRFVFVGQSTIDRNHPHTGATKRLPNTQKRDCVVGVGPYTLSEQERSWFCQGCRQCRTCLHVDLTGPRKVCRLSLASALARCPLQEIQAASSTPDGNMAAPAPPDTDVTAPPHDTDTAAQPHDTNMAAPPDADAAAPPDTDAAAPPDTDMAALPDTDAAAPPLMMMAQEPHPLQMTMRQMHSQLKWPQPSHLIQLFTRCRICKYLVEYCSQYYMTEKNTVRFVIEEVILA